jgi:hypothetical protein
MSAWQFCFSRAKFRGEVPYEWGAQDKPWIARESDVVKMQIVRRCIVHFGLLKTGTTSIQQALFTESNKSGFSYLHLGSPYIGRKLMTAFCQPAWRIAPDLRRTEPSEPLSVRDDLARFIAANNAGPVVVSCESLSLFTESELSGFFEFLRSQGLNPEAAAYIRDYDSWSESIFQQSCRYGTWNSSLFPLGSGAYRFAVEKFDRLLGAENVRLWKYDRNDFPGGCVVRDFFQRCGFLDYHGPSPELNEGLGLEAAKLLLAYHRSKLGEVRDVETFRANARLAAHTRSLSGPPVRFHADLITERMILESADLDWIETRLGKNVRESRYPQSSGPFIRSKEDLCKFSREALNWLQEQSGFHLADGSDSQETARKVAQAMAALRDKLSASHQGEGNTAMRLPKRIWMFWEQGFQSAPPLIKRCAASWQEKNPGWSVHLLDRATTESYLRKANIPWERLQAFPCEKRANILRMRLITEAGGVWADATTFCLRPLDEWLPACMDAGFFCFRDPGPDRSVANWFLAGIPGNRLACLWRDSHEAYWNSGEFFHHSSYDVDEALGLPPSQRALLQLMSRVFNQNTRCTDAWFNPLVRKILRTYPYCVMHYLYAYGTRHNPEWRELASTMTYRAAKPLMPADHLMVQDKSLEEIIHWGLENHQPLLKLNWKRPPSNTQPSNGQSTLAGAS